MTSLANIILVNPESILFLDNDYFWIDKKNPYVEGTPEWEEFSDKKALLADGDIPELIAALAEIANIQLRKV